ncbi:hypothetical protein KUTeg_018522 [Tegillarca granosa]|uniref:Uncharacterized protein n=1 Tax=Tegillarca granosa TaxID=220873 RepID=A0ABQ9EI00_TEGGR|nr:hypothetical protein KUTeg_018522 [Tegillarca granosa]
MAFSRVEKTCLENSYKKFFSLCEILRDLHQFGSFQRKVFILVSLFDLPSAWSMILPVFIGGNPGWTCPVAGNYADYSKSLNFTIDTCSADGSICEGLTS